jgi:hypothetical protein
MTLRKKIGTRGAGRKRLDRRGPSFNYEGSSTFEIGSGLGKIAPAHPIQDIRSDDVAATTPFSLVFFFAVFAVPLRLCVKPVAILAQVGLSVGCALSFPNYPVTRAAAQS